MCNHKILLSRVSLSILSEKRFRNVWSEFHEWPYVPMRKIPLSPELVRVRGGCVARSGGGRGEGAVLIRVGASLRESHPLVQTGRPERFEG